MKRYTFLLASISLLFLNACETKRYELVVNKNLDKVFIINEQGPFELEELVTENDLLGLVDLPQTATIKKIEISAKPRPSIKVYPLNEEGNEANAISISGYTQDGGTLVKKNFFKKETRTVPLIGVDAPFVGLNSLIAEGIGSIEKNLNKLANDVADENFVVGISGDSSPFGGNQIILGVIVRMTLTITYEDCVTVPFGMGDDECDI